MMITNLFPVNYLDFHLPSAAFKLLHPLLKLQSNSLIGILFDFYRLPLYYSQTRS